MQKSNRTIKKGVRKNEQASKPKPPVQKTSMPGGLRAGQAGVPKSPASKPSVKKGLLGAGLGAVAGSPLGPMGMAAGGALGSKITDKQDTKKKKPVKKGLLGAGLGAVAGAPLGPIGMAAGGALGSKVASKQSTKKKKPVHKGGLGEMLGLTNVESQGMQTGPPSSSRGEYSKSEGKPVRKQPKEPVQKFLPVAGLAAGALGGKLLGLQEEEQVPVQKILGNLLGMVGMGGKQEEEPVQKFLPALAPLAAGAIGGKLLGLSKKEGVPIQKIIPLALPLAGALAGPAASAVGSKVMGKKQESEPVQKIIGAAAKLAGPAIGRALGSGAKAAKTQLGGAAKTAATTAATTAGTDIGHAAASKVTGTKAPTTKSDLSKHRTKSFHSHKRKNPFGRKR